VEHCNVVQTDGGGVCCSVGAGAGAGVDAGADADAGVDAGAGAKVGELQPISVAGDPVV